MTSTRSFWTRQRTVARLAALGILASFSSPVSQVNAFSAKLDRPWGGGLGGDPTGERGGGGGGDGGLQIITDGDGDSAGAAGGTRKKRRRRRSPSSSSSSSARKATAGADDGGGVEQDEREEELYEYEGGDNASSASASGERQSDAAATNDANGGWPNQYSTMRAYQEYIDVASGAGMASSSPPLSLSTSPGLAVPLQAAASRGGVVVGGTKAGASPRALSRRGATASGTNGEEKAPKVKNYLGPLLSMTRPDNFPGVVILHVLGAYKTLKQSLLSSGAPLSGLAGATGQAAPSTLKHVLLSVLKEPRMMITLAALLLTTATSMLVNDYYDARSGVDLVNVHSRGGTDDAAALGGGAKGKPLATGAVPLPVAKRFLYYLYAALLLSVPFVPGTAAQFSVIAGAMLTFLYTQHLKPVTWLKNALCAGLIAFSPLTSGMAAASLASSSSPGALAALSPALSSVSRLVLTLFAGFMSREMLMDVTDVEGDRAAGVQTVPVRHGLRYASRAALASAMVMASLAVTGPAVRLVGAGWVAAAAAGASGGDGVVPVLSAVASALLGARGDLVRLGLAALASGLMVRGAWNVYKSDGRDVAAAERAVEEGKLSVLPLLASFI